MNNAIRVEELIYKIFTNPLPLYSPRANKPVGASIQGKLNTWGLGWGAKLPIFYSYCSTRANNLYTLLTNLSPFTMSYRTIK